VVIAALGSLLRFASGQSSENPDISRLEYRFLAIGAR
jgi:hypothetical protein